MLHDQALAVRRHEDGPGLKHHFPPAPEALRRAALPPGASRGSGRDRGRSGGHRSDVELVREVLRAPRRASRRFLAQLAVIPRMVSALNLRHGRPFGAHDLDDVAQEALLSAWRGLRRYRGESSLRTWLCGIARLTFLGTLRGEGRRRRRARPEPTPLEALETPAELPEPELDFDVELLHRALRRLRPGEATVIWLRHFEALGFDEIGRRVGAPPNTAKTRYHRGLVHLHALLLRELRSSRHGSPS